MNNSHLEQEVLGFVAKYSQRYAVKIYAFAIEGNHIQFPGLFTKGNRAQFMRDLNSSIARAVPRHQPAHPGGTFWGRRYSAEYLPGAEDIEEQFFYTVLQPVQDGLVEDIRDYPGYNCFEDAISGATRRYKVVRWKEYNDAKRWNGSVSIKDFTDLIEFRYERLPGYESLSKEEYMRIMREKLKQRTAAIRLSRNGKAVAGKAAIKGTKVGSFPLRTKTSSIRDHRPRILSKDDTRRAQGNAWYFSVYFEYRESSARYRAGELGAKFPVGTYKPPLFTVVCADSIM